MAENNVNAIISSCTILDKSMGLVGVFQLLQLMLHWCIHRMEANLRIKILLLRSACLHAGGNMFNPLLLFKIKKGIFAGRCSTTLIPV